MPVVVGSSSWRNGGVNVEDRRVGFVRRAVVGRTSTAETRATLLLPNSREEASQEAILRTRDAVVDAMERRLAAEAAAAAAALIPENAREKMSGSAAMSKFTVRTY